MPTNTRNLRSQATDELDPVDVPVPRCLPDLAMELMRAAVSVAEADHDGTRYGEPEALDALRIIARAQIVQRKAEEIAASAATIRDGK